ncbi:hypothetical protein [Paenibacillus typhae]|uniref:Uncharacterized protein n=1 Tax=Paenibacillus typhae TaxID=1174501 RepID=A0A1G9EIM8_9BACL|nr:hypothetical protein [Paenibacillus typhae]SDK76027.1 hypothetical protein SAMN05216192_15334 [Paenibacillus typhae]
MLAKKDGISLFALIVALILINIFGTELESRMWDNFTLIANCFLAQGIFITLLNVFRASNNRKPSVGLILLALLTGFITVVLIITAETTLMNQLLFIFIQAMITYAEAYLLRKELKGENGRQI